MNNMTIYPQDDCMAACIIFCFENNIVDYETYCATYCTYPIFFSEVFTSAAEFATKVEAIGTDVTNLEDLYYLLVNKYA